MTKYQSGVAALNALKQSDEGGGSNAEFTPFNSGTTITVKVLGTADLISFFSYGIFKQVNSFVAKNPSKKSQQGNPVEDLTPWDKAWKYHADKSEEFGDHHSQEAYKYKPKQRFALGFIDLDSGEPIIVDLSQNQAQVVHGEILKRQERLDQFAFELTKQGQGTSTSVSLSLIPILDDLTDAQRKNFDEAPKEFDMTLFEGLLYEMDDDEQIEKLIGVGFDVKLIGLEAKEQEEGNTEETQEEEGEPDYDF